MPSSGFVGVSTQTSRVLSRMAARTESMSVSVAVENDSPQGSATLANRRYVPP